MLEQGVGAAGGQAVDAGLEFASTIASTLSGLMFFGEGGGAGGAYAFNPVRPTPPER